MHIFVRYITNNIETNIIYRTRENIKNNIINLLEMHTIHFASTYFADILVYFIKYSYSID